MNRLFLIIGLLFAFLATTAFESHTVPKHKHPEYEKSIKSLDHHSRRTKTPSSAPSSSANATWGSITGTLSGQADLNAALGAKSDSGHNHSGAYDPAGTALSIVNTHTADGVVSGVSIGWTSGTTLPYLSGVTGSVQAQLNFVQGLISGKQAADADLTTWAGITPDASAQAFIASGTTAPRLNGAPDFQTGVSSYVLTSVGPGKVPIWTNAAASAGGAGDMTKAVYDTDADNKVDVLALDLEAATISGTTLNWASGVTLPYLSGVTQSVQTALNSNSPLGYSFRLVTASQSTTTDSQTMYWGGMAVAPSTTAARWRTYIPKAGTIKAAYIYSYAGTAGTNENWSMNIRKNNTTDYLIQTLAANTNDRVWSNTALNIPVVAGDYIEIKEVQPAWATNPATVTRNGVIYIE